MPAREVLRSLPVLVLAAAYFMNNPTAYVFMFRFPTMLKRMADVSDLRLGLLGAVPFAACFVAAGEWLALGPPVREEVARSSAAADRGVRVDRTGPWTAVTWDRDGVVHNGGPRNCQYLRVLLHADRDSEPVGSCSGSGNYQHDGKYLLVPVAILVCISENADRVVYGSVVGSGRGGAHRSDTDIISAETTRIQAALIRCRYRVAGLAPQALLQYHGEGVRTQRVAMAGG